MLTVNTEFNINCRLHVTCSSHFLSIFSHYYTMYLHYVTYVYLFFLLPHTCLVKVFKLVLPYKFWEALSECLLYCNFVPAWEMAIFYGKWHYFGKVALLGKMAHCFGNNCIILVKIAHYFGKIELFWEKLNTILKKLHCFGENCTILENKICQLISW